MTTISERTAGGWSDLPDPADAGGATATSDTSAAAASGLDAEITVRIDGRTLVDRVVTRAPAGAVTALLGPNGAGKSTLLRAIAGGERHAHGSIRFDAVDLDALPRRERARRVALVAQESSTELPLRVAEVVGLGRAPHESRFGGADPAGAGVVAAAMATAGVDGFADRDFGSLSGGERQRVMVARALAQQPRLLLLDEPTNHLDVAAQLDLLALLRRLAEEGVTVVAALHDLALAAAHADHVVVLEHGVLAATGAPTTTLAPELIRRVYGVDAAWTTHPLTGAPLLALAPL